MSTFAGFDFGIRSIPPCIDCDPADGHCTMNCGSSILFRRALDQHARLSVQAMIATVDNFADAERALNEMRQALLAYDAAQKLGERT